MENKDRKKKSSRKKTWKMPVLQETESQILSAIPGKEKIIYGMENDYMFRAVLQKSEEALRGLLSALLHIPESEIRSCVICNPIVLGDAVDEKTCILDIRVILNNHRQINLEMQMGDISNWTDRSLFYLCKMFTDLKKGEDYTKTKSSVHIGILVKSPILEDAAFYNEYALLNRKSGYEFNDKFALHVLDLSCMDKATEEEKNSPLFEWAKVFQAETWEELLKMAEQSEAIKKAVVTMRELSNDEKIRLQCEARERYWMDWTSSMRTNKEMGREEGIAQEKRNTERERKRADEAERKVAEAEERIRKMQELLKKNGIEIE